MRATADKKWELLVLVFKKSEQLTDAETNIENTINGFLISRHIARCPLAS